VSAIRAITRTAYVHGVEIVVSAPVPYHDGPNVEVCEFNSDHHVSAADRALLLNAAQHLATEVRREVELIARERGLRRGGRR
jgi:hypothetical protein